MGKSKKPRKHPAKEARNAQKVYEAEQKAMKKALGSLVTPKPKAKPR